MSAKEIAASLLPDGQASFSSREVEKFAGVKRQTLDLWRAQKRGPSFIRVGRKVIYPRQCLVDFLAINVVQPLGSAQPSGS